MTPKAKFRPLKLKLLAVVVVVSTIFTTVIIAFNFFHAYNRDLEILDDKVQQIRKSSLRSIADSLWSFDTVSLELQAEGITKVTDLVRVRVYDERGSLLTDKMQSTLKDESQDDLKVYSFPIYYEDSHKNNRYIGKIEITATRSNIRKHNFETFLTFILSQFLKTFFLSYAIMLIFHYYLNRNLDQVIKFTQAYDPRELKHLKIKRRTLYSDEFDILEDSINKGVDQIQSLKVKNEIKISEQERRIEHQRMLAFNSSKLAALGEMASGVAHEINNPLSVIYLQAEWIKRISNMKKVDWGQLIKSADSISETVERIVKIISALRNISRSGENEEVSAIPVQTLFNDVLSLCEEKFRLDNIHLYFNGNDTTQIFVNRTQMAQVFLNLLNNSYHAIQKLDKKWIKIEILEDQSWVTIRIIDSGKGIPKQIQDKIFQPFFTTKDVGEGTGLGLSLAYRIVKNHKGEIFYDDKMPNTCFAVRLPKRA